jgi:hypothetical protein
MKGIKSGFFGNIAGFFSRTCCRRLILLLILALAALYEALNTDRTRWSFEFYGLETGKSQVEDRFFRSSSSPEDNIRLYVEEALLGPASPQAAPLFPREARLRSLLLRGGTVYADLSGDAALPPLEGGDVLRNLDTLERGIRRNFPIVKKVRLYIEGNEVRLGRGSKIIANNLRKNLKIAEKALTNYPHLV